MKTNFFLFNDSFRFYNDQKEQVGSRYLNSVFMRRSAATDILDHFLKGLKNLPLHKMLQVSMDGPNVNWKFIELLEEHLWNNDQAAHDFPRFLHLGSCSLHIVHGALNTGHDQAKWQIDTVLSSAYWLFKDSPARRAKYIEHTGKACFPEKFCRTRWLENVGPATKLVENYESLKSFVENVKDPRRKSLKSWLRLEAAFKKPYLKAQLYFFISIAKLVEPFLRRFQSDKPLSILLYEELHDVMRSVMKRIVKPDVLKAAKTGRQLMLIDLLEKKTKTLLDPEEIDLGYGASREIKPMKEEIGELRAAQEKKPSKEKKEKLERMERLYNE